MLCVKDRCVPLVVWALAVYVPPYPPPLHSLCIERVCVRCVRACVDAHRCSHSRSFPSFTGLWYLRAAPRLNTGESGKGVNDILDHDDSVEAARLSIITNALGSADTDADKTINAEEFIKAMVKLQDGLKMLGWPTGKCTPLHSVGTRTPFISIPIYVAPSCALTRSPRALLSSRPRPALVPPSSPLATRTLVPPCVFARSTLDLTQGGSSTTPPTRSSGRTPAPRRGRRSSTRWQTKRWVTAKASSTSAAR